MDSQNIAFIHTVFFWLKKDITEEERHLFRQGVHSLGNIDTVQQFYAGPPAMTPREVVDNSYDYAINVLFASKEDHDIYQEVPIHQKFVEDCKQYWEKVLVYDNLVR